jgi:hypothetical protein
VGGPRHDTVSASRLESSGDRTAIIAPDRSATFLLLYAGREPAGVAANGFAHDRDHALYRYNNSNQYVRAVNHYAAVLAADPAAFTGYHRWDVYYRTTAGDVLLPIGYSAPSPIAVADYLATHPQ